MATTLSDLRSEFLNYVAQPSGTDVYPEDWTNTLIDNVQKEICQNWKLDFLRKKYLFKTGVDTTAGAAIATTDTTITVGGTTGFPSGGGSVLIDKHDIVDFTGTSSTTLTGCTNIGIAHDTSVKVVLLYDLPTDFNRNAEVYIDPTNRNIPYTFVNQYEFDNSDIAEKFTIIQDNDGVEYIRIDTSDLSASETGVFYYHKTPTTLDDDTDNATIPDIFAKRTIPVLAAARAMRLRGDNPDGLADELEAQAIEQIVNMTKYYGHRDQPHSSKVQVDFKSINPRSRRPRKIRII